MTVALAILALGGCSHGTVNELPAAPTAPAPILRVLTITPVGGASLLIGTSAPIASEGPLAANTLGAYGQYSDGSAQYIKATWTSSDSNVLAIEGASVVARGRGTATLTATAEGMKDTEDFTVEPGIDGNWSGTFVVETCDTGSGSLYEIVCSLPSPGRQGGVLPVGTTAPITMQISKAGGTDITAAVASGDLRGTLTGSDRGQNFLTLKGDLTNPAGTKATFVYWDTQVRTDAMQGFIGFEVRVPGLQGWVVVTAHLANVVRR